MRRSRLLQRLNKRSASSGWQRRGARCTCPATCVEMQVCLFWSRPVLFFFFSCVFIPTPEVRSIQVCTTYAEVYTFVQRAHIPQRTAADWCWVIFPLKILLCFYTEEMYQHERCQRQTPSLNSSTSLPSPHVSSFASEESVFIRMSGAYIIQLYKMTLKVCNFQKG